MNFVTTGSQRNSSYVVACDSKEKFERTNDFSPNDKASDAGDPYKIRENIEPVKEAESMLVEHIGQCHSLMEDTKVMALTVALRYGDLVKQDIMKQFQEQLDKKQLWFEEKLQIEKEKNMKAAERVRKECQDRVNSTATTIRVYFKKQMESKDAQIFQLQSKIKELQNCLSRKNTEEYRLNKEQFIMRCAFCAELSPAPFVCSGCWLTFYCGEKCQRLHWSVHEKLCSGASSYQDKGTMTSAKEGS